MRIRILIQSVALAYRILHGSIASFHGSMSLYGFNVSLQKSLSADSDLDPVYHFNADSDPAFHFVVDPVPSPDPAPGPNPSPDPDPAS